MEKLIENKAYRYAEMQDAVKSLCESYPFLGRTVIGRSCAGREIPALTLGKSGEYALLTAAFHGSESLTTTVLLFFIEEICRALAENGNIAGFDARKALYGRGVIFVPRVNPDGCEISLCGKAGCGAMGEAVSRLCHGDFRHWNANLRGVDINHNFSAGWEKLHNTERLAGILGPGPTRYGGARPESEPETLALTELCRKRPIRHAVALHTQGEVIYWTYGETRPPRSEKMVEIMASSSGYAPDTATGISEGGGFKDWFISEFSRPGFTVELGQGENPLPETEAAEIYARVREMLMLCTIM